MDRLTPDVVRELRTFVPLFQVARAMGMRHFVFGRSDHTWTRRFVMLSQRVSVEYEPGWLTIEVEAKLPAPSRKLTYVGPMTADMISAFASLTIGALQ